MELKPPKSVGNASTTVAERMQPVGYPMYLRKYSYDDVEFKANTNYPVIMLHVALFLLEQYTVLMDLCTIQVTY